MSRDRYRRTKMGIYGGDGRGKNSERGKEAGLRRPKEREER